MIIGETITRPTSTMSTTRRSSIKSETYQTTSGMPQRMGYLLVRKQRIERWAYKGRSSSNDICGSTVPSTLSTESAQKSSERSLTKAGRLLNLRVLELSEQRQNIIERSNFDQKLFANKQALKHKESQTVLKTLNYVRKCCKYGETAEDEPDSVDPKIFLEENLSSRRNRSRSPSVSPPIHKRNSSTRTSIQNSATLAETFLKHNKRHIDSLRSSPINDSTAESRMARNMLATMNKNETSTDDESQKRHVQFRITADGAQIPSQSAILVRRSHSHNIQKQETRKVVSALNMQTLNTPDDTQPLNSAQSTTTKSSLTDNTTEQQSKRSPNPRRPLSRITSAKNALDEFRLHPERFLSRSNRYLPLLRRQALDIQSKELSNKSQKDRMDSIKRLRSNLSPSISRLSDGSDLNYDDAKSFLSDDIDIGRNTPIQPPAWLEQERKSTKKVRASSKIDMMDTNVDDTSEYTLAIARLRNREYAHLHDLINSNVIERVLEPLSSMRTTEDEQMTNAEQPAINNYKQQPNRKFKPVETVPLKPTKVRQLSEILHSIDSLRCSDSVDRRARRQVDLEKNRAKLGILIF